MNNKKILIVDDEEQTCFCVSMALKMKGYQTVSAENGEKALQRIIETLNTSSPVDLVICDIQMPKLNGEELLVKLSQMNIKVPVLVVTGFGEKDLVVRLMRQGVRDFIDKPFDPKEIEKRVAMILSRENAIALENQRIETMAKIGLRARQYAHDINNVLAGTMGYADMALGQLKENDVSRQYLTKLIKTTSRAAEICKTLLSASSEPQSCVLVSTEINSILQRSAEILRDVISQSITIEVKTCATPVWCNANAQRLQQALLNLGINAADAMPDGGCLVMECKRVENESVSVVRITVTDTGTGLPDDIKDLIFDNGFTTKKNGNGIGLHTVKEIVYEHRGAVRVDSSLGNGATFAIDIPMNETSTMETERAHHEQA